MFSLEIQKGAAVKRRLFYLALPLPLIARYVPSVTFWTTINMHRDASCYSAFVGDCVSIVFAKVKVLLFSVFPRA